MTNTWDLDKKLYVGKKFNRDLKVEQKVEEKLQPSVKSITYTLKSHFNLISQVNTQVKLLFQNLRFQ